VTLEPSVGALTNDRPPRVRNLRLDLVVIGRARDTNLGRSSLKHTVGRRKEPEGRRDPWIEFDHEPAIVRCIKVQIEHKLVRRYHGQEQWLELCVPKVQCLLFDLVSVGD